MRIENSLNLAGKEIFTFNSFKELLFSSLQSNYSAALKGFDDYDDFYNSDDSDVEAAVSL